MARRKQPAQYEDGLKVVLTTDRSGLVNKWRKDFGHAAPRNAQVPLLRNILAWHTQVSAGTDGVTQELARQLRNWSAHAAVLSLERGTCLLREWKGQIHQVNVLEKGFEYEGETYPTLTRITRKITGMSWSGPLFFGLRK